MDGNVALITLARHWGTFHMTTQSLIAGMIWHSRFHCSDISCMLFWITSRFLPSWYSFIIDLYACSVIPWRTRKRGDSGSHCSANAMKMAGMAAIAIGNRHVNALFAALGTLCAAYPTLSARAGQHSGRGGAEREDDRTMTTRRTPSGS